MVKIVSWNIARRDEAWRCLVESDVDIALLQEAAPPPADVAARVDVDAAPWVTAGTGVHRPWRTAVVKLSDRVDVRWLETNSLPDAPHRGLAVSRPGTLAAALVSPRDGEPFFVVSMYAAHHQAARKRLGRQRGKKIARVETARKLAEAIFYMLTREQPFAPTGPALPLVA